MSTKKIIEYILKEDMSSILNKKPSNPLVTNEIQNVDAKDLFDIFKNNAECWYEEGQPVLSMNYTQFKQAIIEWQKNNSKVVVDTGVLVKKIDLLRHELFDDLRNNSISIYDLIKLINNHIYKLHKLSEEISIQSTKTFTLADLKETLRVGVNIGMGNVENPRYENDYNFNRDNAIKQCSEYIQSLSK